MSPHGHILKAMYPAIINLMSAELKFLHLGGRLLRVLQVHWHVCCKLSICHLHFFCHAVQLPASVLG